MRKVGIWRFSSAMNSLTPTDDLFLVFHGALELIGSPLDFGLHEAGIDGPEHAAESVNFEEIVLGARFDFVGQGFDGVRTTDGIGGVGDASFGGNDLLRAECDQRGIFGGKGQGFVHGIRVERLAAAENGGEGLNRHADDIIFGLLRSERRSGGLRVETQQQRTGIFCGEALLHDFGPQAAGGAKLGNFFEQIAVGVEEERKLGSEIVDGETSVERGLNVSDSIRKSKCNFLNGGRASFTDVIARDGDGVPLGKSFAAPGKNIGDDAHGRTDGIDVCAASDVFLEDIVLSGAGKSGKIGALFFRHGDVEAKKNRSGGVDGHGSGDAFERDVLEERFHVLERIDGNADFANFAESEGMIGVHANLRGQIERDGKALLSFAEQIPITLIGFGGAAKAGVLAHGPETAAVHSGINSAGVREFAGETWRE